LDASSRRAVVRERIAAGVLPARPCAEVWGGRGTDTKCAACEKMIGASGYEFECRAESGQVFTVCQPCLYVWDALTRETEQMVG